jgi:hypothetical protein
LLGTANSIRPQECRNPAGDPKVFALEPRTQSIDADVGTGVASERSATPCWDPLVPPRSPPQCRAAVGGAHPLVEVTPS